MLPSPLFLAAVAAAHSARAARGRAFHIKSAAEPTVGAYAQDGAGAGKPIKSPAPFLSLEEAGVCEARGELSGFVRERPSECVSERAARRGGGGSGGGGGRN